MKKMFGMFFILISFVFLGVNVSAEADATGFYGTVYWEFDKESGKLNFYDGALPDVYMVNLFAGSSKIGRTDEENAQLRKWDRDMKAPGGLRLKSYILGTSSLKNEKIKHIVFNKRLILHKDSYALFSDLPDLESIENANLLDVSRVENMSALFYKLPKLKKIDISEWDTSEVRFTTWMFMENDSLSEINISNWNVNKLLAADRMFEKNKSLKKIDVSKWNPVNLMSAPRMFYQNESLETLDLSGWSFENCGTLRQFLANSSKLKSLNISGTKEFDFTVDLEVWRKLTAFRDPYTVHVRHETEFREMLQNTPELNEFILGPGSFSGNKGEDPTTKRNKFATIVEKKNEEFTGRWINEDGYAYPDSKTFISDYDGTHPGVYRRERVKN